MSEDLTGSRLGHYKIDGVLGRGGMSVMYRATDTRLGRKVALKVMGQHITDDGEFRERFVDEARNTSAIDHANIVPLYDFGEVDGMLYIAMRLVDGSDLAGLIKDGPIAPKRALELLSQISEALDMLAERGLVHLDLKPANVLVTSRESSSEHVYLADFGLTRRGATGHRTSSGDFLGSPTYAAPEHLRGEPVDGRTDLYALACMLFACLTGRPPFQGQVTEVIHGHLRIEPPAVTSAVVLPTAIDDVVRKGMAKKADQRFSTCKEMLDAAKAALAPVARPSMPPPLRRQIGQPDAVPAPSPMPPQAAGAPGFPVPPAPQMQPHTGGFPQPYQQAPVPQPPAGPLPPPSRDPIRLRPPMQAQSPPAQAPLGQSAPAPARSGGSARVIVPVLIGAAAVVIVLVFVIMASSLPG